MTVMVGALVLALSGVGAWTVGSWSGGVVDAGRSDPVVLAPLATRTIVYNDQGAQMAVLFAEEDRQEVPLSKVPMALREAVIATEDADFYHHSGVSLRGWVRALGSDLRAGGVAQGGSTITQQLVKKSITGSAQTPDRKVREAVLAVRLEQHMSKDAILERYLNTVYLGHGNYGVEAAAESYFGVGVAGIDWPKAALLAGMIASPSRFDPIAHPEAATRRRSLVVGRLLATGRIDAATARAIRSAPLPTRVDEHAAGATRGQLVGGSYFAEQVKQQLLDMPALGATPTDRYNRVFGGGLRVYTTFDPIAQAAAERAVDVVPGSGERFFTGLASLDAHTGAVRALVGGPDFATSQFNYVTQGWRQPGSSFKFFVLMAAMEAGYVPTDTISGASCRFPDPTAPSGVYETDGGKSAKTASILAQTQVSSNCAFLRLGQTVGLDRVARMANNLGVRTVRYGTDGATPVPIPDDVLSLPLGTTEVHPIDMAAAYATAANDGVYNPPFFIDRITDSNGRVLYRHRRAGLRVTSAQTARLVTGILQKNVTGGTGRRARLSRQVAAGKTGTTQAHADAWFVGYTPYLSTAVWMGEPTGRSPIVIGGKQIFGADYPAEVWRTYTEATEAALAPVSFTPPAPTRPGKAIRYRNRLDSGASTSSTSKRVPSPGPTSLPVPTTAVEPGVGVTRPSSPIPDPVAKPSTSVPATTDPPRPDEQLNRAPILGATRG
ncbi:MAG: transglycosylase domain-containing protein [Microthrixaceae bacterium]